MSLPLIQTRQKRTNTPRCLCFVHQAKARGFSNVTMTKENGPKAMTLSEGFCLREARFPLYEYFFPQMQAPGVDCNDTSRIV